MTLKNKYKVSAYLTDSEVELLDSLATQWECSKSQAIIRAIRVLTNSDNNPNPIPNPIPPHSVNVGLSKEDVELLIEQKIELLVNPKLELLGEHTEKKLSDLTTEIETIKAVLGSLQKNKPVKDATEETPNDGEGLTGVALAKKFPEEYGVKCSPEYLSLFLANSRRCPDKVREILEKHWTYQARRWYPKT
jgi:hypothetical protein